MNWESLPPEWNESVICLLTYSQYIPLCFIQLKNGNPLRPANMARWKSPNSIRSFAGQQKSTHWRIRNAKQLTPYRKHTSFKMV